MKPCDKCKSLKELEDFSIDRNNRKDGRRTICKTCANEISKVYYQSNKEARKVYNIRRNHELKRRFKRGIWSAKKRGYDCQLLFEQWLEIISSGICHYCNGELEKTGFALDRKDNNIGYLLDNVVTCCRRCNDMKGPHLSYDEMTMIWSLRKIGTNEAGIGTRIGT